MPFLLHLHCTTLQACLVFLCGLLTIRSIRKYCVHYDEDGEDSTFRKVYNYEYVGQKGQITISGDSDKNDWHCNSDCQWCTTSADCAFNGECIDKHQAGNSTKHGVNNGDPESPGHCQCFPGWKGSTCEVLDLLPVDYPKHAGLKLPNHDSSTWGGSVSYNQDDGLYHMFASEIIYNCGLYAWTTNSQVIRAVSSVPTGPYTKRQVVVPVFAHDANIIRAPTGEWVLFVTAQEGVVPRDCRHKNGQDRSSAAGCKSNNTMRIHNRMTQEVKLRPITTIDTNKDKQVPPKDTYMLWAPRPQGPWSKPVMVLNSTIWNSDYWAKYNRTAKCDSNLNGIILQSGNNSSNSTMFIGLWRRCETPDLHTIPHTLVASDWKNASTYQPSIDPLFVLAGSGAEDPSNIWTTQTSDMLPGQVALHSIFHDEQATRCMSGQCGGSGRHAVALVTLGSDDEGGTSDDNTAGAWRYATVNAYDRHVTFSNGTILHADTRARPHMILLDPLTHQQPIALSTGLKETDESGYVWTLVAPLRVPQ